MLEEGGKQGSLHAVAAADNADPDTVIGAQDGGVTAGIP
jgi:hypothetical protein